MAKKSHIQKVEPIRDLSKIEEMKSVLRARSERDWFLFCFGLNTGMRISDILSLRYKDLQNTHIVIREKKTDKIKRFVINQELRRMITDYSEGKNLNEYVFKQKYGTDRITRQYAHRAFKQAGLDCGMDYIGTHSMRKTFGYYYYKATKDVATLQEIFNHSAPSITLKYIGIRQEQIDDSLEKFHL
jgi:integrase